MGYRPMQSAALPPGLLTKAAYARARGWSASYVTYLIGRGVIVLRPVPWRVEPVVDVQASDAAYGGSIRPRVHFGRAGPSL